jgi:hypothetical protein
MAKRKHSDLTETTMHMMIDRLAALHRPEARFAEQLRLLIPDLLNAEGGGGVTKAAGDFTLSEVVEVFGLNYSTIVSPDDIEQHAWRIEDSKLYFTITPCLGKLPIPSFNS